MKRGRFVISIAASLSVAIALAVIYVFYAQTSVTTERLANAQDGAKHESGDRAETENAAVVAVESAVPITDLAPRQYAGRLSPIDDVDIVPRVTGWIEKVNFKEGDNVEAGDLLFELEDTTYVVAVRKAEAGLAQAEAELKNADTNYNRAKELLERNAGSQLDFDNAEQRLAQARAAVQLAEASLTDAKNTLSYTKITTPISGRIGKVTVTRGNLVTPQTGKIVDVKSFSPIHLKFAIGESVFSHVFEGEKRIRELAQIRVCPVGEDREDPEAIAKYPEAKIELVDNIVDPSTNTVVIWATLENADNRFFPGSYATVLLSRKLQEPLVGVLLSALQTNGSEEFVYVVNSENRVERRVITCGPISGKYQVVYSGVNAGETVVVEGMNKLQDGALVAPVAAKSSPQQTR